VQACADHTDVLYVAYDIEARGPLARVAHSRGLLGMALVLRALNPAVTPREADRASLRLVLAEDGPDAATHAAADDLPGSANAMATGLVLMAALQGGLAQELRLPLGPGSILEVSVRHR
jgi:hypothetical protein